MKTPRGISSLGTLLFFVIFLIALGLLWVGTGGPSRTISHGSPFLKPPTSPGVAIGGKITKGGVIEEDTDYSNNDSLLDQFFNSSNGASGETRATSPYATEIKLSAGNADSNNPDTEYITITTSRKSTKTLTITGWTLESKASAIRAPIGSAAQGPISGQINNDSP